jgi:hypothetical protein
VDKSDFPDAASQATAREVDCRWNNNGERGGHDNGATTMAERQWDDNDDRNNADGRTTTSRRTMTGR